MASQHTLPAFPDASPADTGVTEALQGASIIIIQPGSYNLRIGRASDVYPCVIPNCIARAHKNPGNQAHYNHSWIRRSASLHPDTKVKIKRGLQMAEEALKFRPMSSGEHRQPTSIKQLAIVNSRVRPQISEVKSPHSWTDTSNSPQVIVGKDALYINPKDDYDVHWPIRCGRLNVHSGIGGSISAIKEDIFLIWKHALRDVLKIPIKDLKNFRVVLLVPDIYTRRHVKEMVNILLDRLEFSAVFVHQESVCATFGAGVASACVVDVGDQKISVSCVEDGLSQKNTRVCLEYGGSDVTRSFMWLLSKAGFPFKSYNLSNSVDAIFAQNLKENCCHLNQDISRIEDKHIQIKIPEENIIKFTIKMGDERMLAPLALFYPDMLGLQSGKNFARVMGKSEGDPEDPHDDEFLLATQRKHEMSSKKKGEAVKESVDTQADDEDMNDSQLCEQHSDGVTLGSMVTVTSRGDEEEDEGEADEDASGWDIIKRSAIGIDQAILQSIDHCECDEMKRRMYNSILLVGGGMMFSEAQSLLRYALVTQIPEHFKYDLDYMEVITDAKEMDSSIVCWKGAAIMSCLDTARELWIKKGEWAQFGVKLLRERSPFVW